MNKKVITLKLSLVAILISSLSSCYMFGEEDPPECRAENFDPGFYLFSDSFPISIRVRSPNSEPKIWKILGEGISHYVRLDLNETLIEVDVLMPDSIGTLKFTYNIDAEKPAPNCDYLLLVRNFKMDTASTFTELFTDSNFDNQFIIRVDDLTRNGKTLYPLQTWSHIKQSAFYGRFLLKFKE